MNNFITLDVFKTNAINLHCVFHGIRFKVKGLLVAMTGDFLFVILILFTNFAMR